MLVVLLMAGSVVANAAQEVAFDSKDTRPLDQRHSQTSGVFSKVLTHEGQLYTVMYEARQQNRDIATRVIAVCSIFSKDSISKCTQEPRTPTTMAVYNKAIAERKKGDCAEIALIHADNMKVRAAISDFNEKKATRDSATNQREMAIIMNGLGNQVEALSVKTNNQAYASNVSASRELMNLVANRQVPEADAIQHMVTNINILNDNYADLLSKTQCTNEQLQVCAINKQNGQIVTPGTHPEAQLVYNELLRRKVIEIKACSLAPQQPTGSNSGVIAPAPPANPPAVIQPKPVDPNPVAVDPNEALVEPVIQ